MIQEQNESALGAIEGETVIDLTQRTDEHFDWLSAMTPHASPETLDGLDLAGKAQIAYRPDARRSTLDRLARCMDTDIKTAVLRNPGVGPSGSTITYLAMSAPNETIRELAVTHRNSPKRLTELALHSPDSVMRTYVVHNPHITINDLKWLAKDKDKRVSKAAKEQLEHTATDSIG